MYIHLRFFFFSATSNVIQIGYERIDGIWTWFDGRTYPSDVGYGLWGNIEPNNDVDCASFYVLTGKILDSYCTRSSQYVCMKQ